LSSTPVLPRVLLCGLPAVAADWLASGLPGVTIDVATSAPGALESLATRRYGAVVLNHPFSVPGGEEVLSRLARPGGEAAPRLIGLIEATIDPAEARRLVTEYGAVKLLVHPLDADEFVRQVAWAMGMEPPLRGAEAAERAEQTQAVVAGVWSRFEGALRARVESIGAASAAIRGGALGSDLRELAERDAHKLAGSLGTFGLALGTRLAREAESLLAAADPAQPAIGTRLSEIAAVLDGLVTRGPRIPTSSDQPAPRILLVDRDPHFLNSLALSAAAQGYIADTARTLDEARELLAAHRPQVAVVDLAIEDEVAAGHALMRALSAFSAPVPVVALTPRRVLNDRVEAARLGARIFLQKPVTAQRVIAEVSTVVQQLFSNRPKILAVDDDPQLLGTLRVLLENEGLEVTPLEDPLEFWNTLEAVNPDLVILDVDMPSITGLELCRVIRSDPRWCTLPVLFLTARGDPASVHRVFAAGADDYVSKPVVGPELVTRIRNRLERLALLRKLSDFDALTEVPNRRRSMELIEQLQRIAERQQQPLCFALLDIDGFKMVNDRHGHGAGDEVLHALAAFLERQFRGEDVVGRWGGEEFALGLFGIRRAAAAQRIRHALRAFSNEEFPGRDGQPFRVTVSAGVAEFPSDGADLEDLYRAADEALYRAKDGGRNRVEEAFPGGRPRSFSPVPNVRLL
jgi:diguanylate cyclase (GGDEF)-like protein